MDFDLTPEQREFKASVAAWLRDNPPQKLHGMAGDATSIGQRRKWQRNLYEAGFVGIEWPQAYGGRGASTMEQVIVAEAMIEAGAPELVNVIGLGMAAPSILEYGTEEQKRRYLAPILSAEEIWCQGFSEPDAGSDLSALRTRAEDRGDHYLVNGQKVWTSYAHVAKWCLLVARERTEPNPREGLTYLLVDMGASGIDVRPLVQITGDAEFNEIFFNDVVVPKSQVLGAVGQGWRVAMATLTHERARMGVTLAAQVRLAAEELIADARSRGSGSDPLIRQKVAQLYLECRLLQLTGYRFLAQDLRRGGPGPEGALIKLEWSEINQRIREAIVDIAGMSGLAAHTSDGRMYEFLRSRGNSIEAGTSEVLRNSLAERVLGLPRSR